MQPVSLTGAPVSRSERPVTLRNCSSQQLTSIAAALGMHPVRSRSELILIAGALGNRKLQKELGSMELSTFYDGMVAAGKLDGNPYWPRHKKEKA